MNTKRFSIAMGEIESSYVEKALNYHSKKRRYLLSCAASLAVLFVCGSAYAACVYWGIGSADHIDFNKLTQPFGTVAGEQESNENSSTVFYEKSGLINDYENIYADYSACVATENGTIPSIYFSPAYMVIFSREDGQGWSLEAEDQLTLDFSLYRTQSLELEIGYIMNGEYYALSLTKGCDFNEIFTVSDAGEYYFCVTNHSSENAVIKNGRMTVGHSGADIN